MVDPDEQSVAEAFNRMFRDDGLYSSLLEGCRKVSAPGDWQEVVEALTASSLVR